MTEITLTLKDDIIKQYGEIFIKDFFQKQIEYLSFLRNLDRVEEQVKISKMDYDKELDSLRANAWEEYKKDYFKTK